MKISYPEALPVSRHRDEIGRAMLDNQVVIVCGDTGSGKTTQLPKIAVEAIRAIDAKSGRGAKSKDQKDRRPLRIGCTQPRRLAATSVATRVAEEMACKVGEEVGYQIRFQDRTSKNTLIKFMTDGILLAETQGDPSLRQYSTLIIDEAHERSLNIDFILGYLCRILPKRPDLKIMISSATLDAGTFSDFFGGAPVISVEGRTFPVTDDYLPAESEREQLSQHVARAADILGHEDPLGDTLVFLPGEREIRECADVLQGRAGPNTLVLPLYARQAGNEQQQVFRPNPKKRRIILATNVAETSLTIPDIRSVIDSGIARVNRFNPGTGIQRLQIEKISQASANQRRGRCGRVSEGICMRLYDEEDFLERKEFTDPEILRTNLSGVVLQMEHLGLGSPADFPFLDPPQPSRITQAYRTLEEIGGIRKITKKDDPNAEHRWSLTKIGQILARLPLDPRVGRILVSARDENCLREGIIIAASLTVQDPKERPQDKQAQADQKHAQWKDKRSDYTAWLRLWHALDTAKRNGKGSTNSVRKFAKANYLNFRRTLEWTNLHREIRSVLRDMKWKLPDEKRPMPDPEGSFSEGLHKSILAAIPSHIGMHIGKKGKGYKGARNREFFIHPGSNLKGTSPGWVMAFEVVETARLFARNVSSFDPKWFEKVCPHLVSYRHSAAQWNPDQGAVYGEERVTAFGLVLEAARPIHYGRLKPVEAREIFLWEALINGNTKHPLPGLDQHRAIRERVGRMEHKLRRRDGLLFPESIYGFYDERVPAEVNTCKAYERWVNGFEGPFDLSLEDCIVPQTHAISDDGFPDQIASPVSERSFPLHYLHAFHEDELGADGLTVEIAIGDLAHLPQWFGTWLVPGQLSDKVEALLRTLNKDIRRLVPPVGEVIESFLVAWEGYLPEVSLIEALVNHLEDSHGITASLADFDQARIPEHLNMRFLVLDDQGRALASGRDLPALQAMLAGRMQDRVAELSRTHTYHRDNLSTWDFGDLPVDVALDAHSDGYPALCDTGYSCGMRVFGERTTADWHHPRGLASLYQEDAPDIIADLKKALQTPSASDSTKTRPSAQPTSSALSHTDTFSLAAAFDSPQPHNTPPPANPNSQSFNSKSQIPNSLLTITDLLALTTLGPDPSRNFDDLISLIIRRAFQDRSASPRNGLEWESDTDSLRPALFDAAATLCTSLRGILHSAHTIATALDNADRVYADSITDARHHLDQLLRSGWLAETDPTGLARTLVHFRGLEARITRMCAAPAIKDETKMERVFADLSHNDAAHAPNDNCPCGLTHSPLARITAIEEENSLRLQHFAPEVR